MVGRFRALSRETCAGPPGVHVLETEEPAAQGNRAPVVAMKPANPGGAKGGREMET